MRIVAAVFAIGDGVEAKIDLKLHNVLYGGVFDGSRLLLSRNAIVSRVTSLEEVVRAEERA